MDKISAIWFRFSYIITSYPRRIIRFTKCFTFPFDHRFNKLITSLVDWIAFCVFTILDLMCIPEFIEIIQELFKWRTKNLNADQKKILYENFPNILSSSVIRIDEHAHIGPKQWRIAYVGFHTINSYGMISDRLLIHELVHIWQYEQFGSFYIYKALLAQYSSEAYNYGGIRELDACISRGGSLMDYNFEQQASIIEHVCWMSHLANDQIIDDRRDYFINDMLKSTY